jgi:hypothetical protein
MDLNRKDLKKVALSGRANVGKNTAANLLAEHLCSGKDEPYDMLAFADPIKRMVEELFPWAEKKCLYGPSKLRNNIIPRAINKQGAPLTYRQALIDIGTLGRSYKSDIWIDNMDNRIKNLSEDRSIILQDFSGCGYRPIKALVITDLRFVNEMEYLKSKGFFIIRLLRDTDQVINHGTETEQEKIRDDEFDLVIDNNSTLENLTKQIDQIRL